MSSDAPKMLDDLPTALPASKLGEYTVIGDIAEGTFGVVKSTCRATRGNRRIDVHSSGNSYGDRT